MGGRVGGWVKIVPTLDQPTVFSRRSECGKKGGPLDNFVIYDIFGFDPKLANFPKFYHLDLEDPQCCFTCEK